MKPPIITHFCAALAVGVGLALTAELSAQTVTTTREVTSEGTISSFEPHDFVIRSEAAARPLTYGYTTSTRYVDDSGAVITRETIQPGAPVTVYYTRDGDRLLASRVIVHRTATVPAAPAAETTTTTRTTTTEERPLTKKEAKEERKHEKEMREHPEREERREDRKEDRGQVSAPPVQNSTTETVTTSDGTISSFAPDEFAIRSTTTESPVSYRYSKTTQYVDDLGNPVNVEVVRSGVPVTVHYVHDNGGLVAQRVIVHRSGPPVGRPLPPP